LVAIGEPRVDALSQRKFQFVIKTANARGITIPPLLLNQADKVIS
jgi:hypothetical protein